MSFALSITPPTSARKCRTCVALVPVGHKRAYRQMGRCDSCAHTEFTRRTRLGFVFLAPRARVIEPIVARMRERAHLEPIATDLVVTIPHPRGHGVSDEARHPKWMSLSPRKGIGGEQDRTPLERYGLSNVLLIRATKGQGGQTTAIGAGFERFSA